MKKLLGKILAILLVVVMVTAFSACSKSAGAPSAGPKPELDLRKAEDNLEDNGYEVYKSDDFDSDFMGYAVEKFIEAYDDHNEIILIECKSNKGAEKLYNYMVNDELEISIMQATIDWYEFLLKEYGDDMYSGEREELEDEIKEYKEELEGLVYGFSGKYVWFATDEDAIEDTKG